MAWKVGITKNSSVCNKNKFKKFGNLRCFSKYSNCFDSPGISNFTVMIKKLISFFAVSIGYPLLILGKDPFSTKLI